MQSEFEAGPGQSKGESSVGGLRVVTLSGAALTASLPRLAELRVEVFREFPYLYDGDLAYERKYLTNYADGRTAVVVGAFDGKALVGAATGGLLSEQKGAWVAPLTDRGFPPEQVFYCGESVLSAAYRGKGVGNAFFDHRERAARALGARYAAFVAVIRAEDHPERPKDYRPLDAFWRKRGYAPVEGAIAEFEWRQIGDSVETTHQLQYWAREL